MDLEATGAPVHTRTLVVSLAQLASDRILASGAIVDVRKRGLVPMASDLQTSGVIHDMRVRAEIALDPARVAAISVEQASVAFEPSIATGGECCRDPGPRIAALVETPLDGDAHRRLGNALGGPLGCSHVLTLAQLLLSTAQTALVLDRKRHGAAVRAAGERIFHRSLSIDGLLGRDGLHLALQQADVHFTPIVPRADTQPLERLAGRLEIRAQAEVDPDAMVLRSLRAAERESGRDSFYGAWCDRSAPVADLAGRSALAGMAGALFARLGERAEDRPLLDALLNLAPTLIQCVPAVMERWQSAPNAPRPGMMAGGGMTDSCYMWRSGGALQRRLAGEIAAIRAVESGR
jgi:Protein of unknown function (DUF2889)